MGAIETAAIAARIQAYVLFPDVELPDGDSLLDESVNWACIALNCTATVSNPFAPSPYLRWHGHPPVSSLPPFLKPGYCKVKRNNNVELKAEPCFYLGPQHNNQSVSVRIFANSRSVIIVRDVIWAH